MDISPVISKIQGLPNVQVSQEKPLEIIDTFSKSKVPTTEETKQAFNNKKLTSLGWLNFGGEVGDFAYSQDPSATIRVMVTMAHNQNYSLIPEGVLPGVVKNLPHAVRFLCTILDITKAVSTIREKSCNILDKVIDIGHVVADIGGIAGWFLPKYPGLQYAANIADTIAAAYHACNVPTSWQRFVRKRYPEMVQDSNNMLKIK